MRKLVASMTAILLAGIVSAAAMEPGIYPTEGVINRDQGTVEVTINPVMDVKDIRNSWFFALAVPGKDNSGPTRTALGIYCPSGNPESDYGFRAIVRGNDRKAVYIGDQNSPLKANVPVNIAVTWGPKGVFFLANGSVIGRAAFPGQLLEMAPWFTAASQFPFYTQRLKVSAVQLDPAGLQTDPAKDFVPDPETTLIANTLDKPRFLAAPTFKNAVALTPFGDMADRFAFEDEAVKLRLVGNNFAAAAKTVPVKVTVARMDADDKPILMDKSVNLPANAVQQPIDLDIGKLPPGPYRVELRAGDQGMRFIQLSILPRLPDAKDGKFVEYLGLASHDEPGVFKKIGIRWARLWCEALGWFHVEPADGAFDWRGADRIVDGYLANGVKMLGVLGYPAKWAATPPPRTGPGSEFRYRHGEPGRWKPASVERWDRYVKAVAERYKGKIAHYEIYNEVDFHPPGLAESFSGTTEEYFALLKGASEQLRAASPENKVLISGFSNTPGVCDINMPADLVKLGAGQYVDIWNLHSYRGRVGAPEMKKLAQSAKPGMPIWQTEQMWHVIADPVRRAYLTAAINFWYIDMGYDKYFAFGWNRDVLSNEHIVSPEPVLHAFAVNHQFLRACDRFVGFHPALSQTDFDVNHVLRRTDGAYFTAIGSSVGDYAIRFSNKNVRAWDHTGRPLDLSRGVFRTGGAITYLISAEPLDVTEAKLQEAGQLLPNPGFEDLVGDTLVGLAQCKFAGWQGRDTAYDPQGRITPVTEGANGKYAVRLETSGKGRVYVFAYLKLAGPGDYRIKAKFKNLSGNAKPYISTFDTAPGANDLRRQDYPVAPSDRLGDHVFETRFDRVPAETVAIIFGIDGAPGTVLLDDVEMYRYEKPRLAEKDAELVPLTAGPRDRKLTVGHAGADLGNLKALGEGVKVIGGIPYRLGDRVMAVSDASWNGGQPTASQAVAPGKYPVLFLLGSAQYVTGVTGTPIADLVLTYADGSNATLPLRDNVELRDWYLAATPKNGKPIPVAQSFSPPDLHEYGVYAAQLANPHPDRTLTGLELRKTGKGIVVLSAVTLARIRMAAPGVAESLFKDGDFDQGLKLWQPRPDRDPQGKIAAKDGGVEIAASGKGIVYIFQEVEIKEAGTYLVSGRFKRTDGTPDAYIGYYDRTTHQNPRQAFGTPKGDDWSEWVYEAKFDKPSAGKVAIIFGLTEKKAGTVLLDQVAIRKQ